MRGLELLKNEFINFVINDEIGVFVVSINGNEDIMNAKELLEISEDIEVFDGSSEDGFFIGELYGKSIGINVI